MNKNNQEKAYDTTLQLIGTVAKLPIIRVGKDEFLKKLFASSPYIDDIIANGPQSVFTVDALRKKASELIKSCTNKTSVASFVSGLPSNPIAMVAAGGADVVQYFAFAINMAQQIAYLFGEAELFNNTGNQLTEDDKVRIIAYLGVMLGAGGAATIIANISKVAGANIGKKVAAKSLTKTAWYPLVKKVGAIIGQKITKQTVSKTLTKAVPIVGGVISGGLTYITFRPMGEKLADVFAKNLLGEVDSEPELNPEFLMKLSERQNKEKDIINAPFTEVEIDE